MIAASLKARTPTTRAAKSPEALIRLKGLSKHYAVGSGSFTALADVDLEVAAGEFLAIVVKLKPSEAMMGPTMKSTKPTSQGVMKR